MFYFFTSYNVAIYFGKNINFICFEWNSKILNKIEIHTKELMINA